MFNSIGIKTVTIGSTGVAVGLTGLSIPCNRVDIQALNTNTGHIFVGDRGVQLAASTGGIDLAPGDVYNIELITDLISIGINGTAGDSVSLIYWIGDRS